MQNVDYATCPLLPSVRAFSVQRVAAATAEAQAPFHYFEVITVSGLDDFAEDMKSEAFQALVTDFESMASVVEEVCGSRIGPGYRASVRMSPDS